MIRCLIIEDEKIAAESLKLLLDEVEPESEVVAVLQTVEDSVIFLQSNPDVDLVFADIHLADGSAFAIFERVEVKCPVIFTTAYDEYAIKAFKVNSIDYLLKPIIKDDLQCAIKKFKKITNSLDFSNIFRIFASEIKSASKKYKSYFLIPERDKLVPVSVNDIAYIYICDKLTKVVVKSNKSYILSQNLDEVYHQLDPTLFFRANRQFVVAHDSIKDVTLWFGNKISLNMKVPTPEKIIVSKARVAEFKAWYSA
ncbi:MAG: LytR/AlgR family response regulator transcription factor [Candidatus Limimorpha sp.]